MWDPEDVSPADAAACVQVLQASPSIPVTIRHTAQFLDASIWQPIQRQILELELRRISGLNTDTIPPLPHLLALSFSDCQDVTFTRRTALRLNHLRQLTFVQTTFRMFEQGALESLPVLQHLSLDAFVNSLSDADREKHLRTFHCSKEHAAFRRHLDTHPYLLTSEGINLYTIGCLPTNSWDRYTLRSNFYPVDCSRADLTQAGDFDRLTAFAINVPA